MGRNAGHLAVFQDLDLQTHRLPAAGGGNIFGKQGLRQATEKMHGELQSGKRQDGLAWGG